MKIINNIKIIYYTARFELIISIILTIPLCPKMKLNNEYFCNYVTEENYKFFSKSYQAAFLICWELQKNNSELPRVSLLICHVFTVENRNCILY